MMSRLSSSSSSSAFLAPGAATSAWVAGDPPRVRASLLGRSSGIGGSSPSGSRFRLQGADLARPTRSATSWADDARDARALAAAAFPDASDALGCVAPLSPGACPSVRSASFAVHLGHPSPCLARASRSHGRGSAWPRPSSAPACIARGCGPWAFPRFPATPCASPPAVCGRDTRAPVWLPWP